MTLGRCPLSFFCSRGTPPGTSTSRPRSNPLAWSAPEIQRVGGFKEGANQRFRDSGDSERERIRDSEIQRGRESEIQRGSEPEIQGFRESEIQRLRESESQRFRESESQRGLRVIKTTTTQL